MLPDRRSGTDRRKIFFRAVARASLRDRATTARGSRRRHHAAAKRASETQPSPDQARQKRVRLMEDPGMGFAERAARNEEIFRGVNERIEEGAEQHGVSGSLPFHCECGRASCVETIEIAVDRYAAVVRQRYQFVVIPGHQETEIERVVKIEPDFLVVEKIGEAREQIDHDHPQQHHHG
jgi:hypothetical protein